VAFQNNHLSAKLMVLSRGYFRIIQNIAKLLIPQWWVQYLFMILINREILNMVSVNWRRVHYFTYYIIKRSAWHYVS